VAAPEILIVGCANTLGWRINEAEFAASLERLGVSSRIVRRTPTLIHRIPRTYAMAELAEARAARRALREGLQRGRPRAVVLMSSTAGFFIPVHRLRRAGIGVGIRVDCPAAVNRPGVAGLPQRSLERRRLPQASAVIAMGPRSAATVAGVGERIIALPATVDVPAASNEPGRPPRLLAYCPNPGRKGIDRIVWAWDRLGRERGDAVLTISGLEPRRAARALRRAGVTAPMGVEFSGAIPRRRHLELLRGATAFVSASRWEEWGIAQLEALAAGVPLVTTPARGAYEAEPLARELAPELVAPEEDPGALAAAMRAALRMDAGRRARYRAEAAHLVEPFAPGAVDRVMAEQVLPALLGARR
jgi:glycosyltransferase involved in cell wall biosynthesis